MTLVGLYVFIVATWTTGLLGHTPVLGSLARSVLAWASRRSTRGRRQAPVRPAPSWARDEGQ